MKRKIAILTGAGISQESGIKTFRTDNGKGLWDEYKIEDVATPTALKYKTQVFCDFYNKRKNELKNILPNKAHLIIKDLEEYFDIIIISTNVDDLHEKAGSTNIYHLHGTLSKIRSSFNPAYEIDYIDDIKVGDVCPDGAQMRPSIVLFGEGLPHREYELSIKAFEEADVVIIVGTSMQVYPAAGLPWVAKETAIIYYVDPGEMMFEIPKQRRPYFYHIKEAATVGMKTVFDDLQEIYF